jgi:hypothetical protein
MSSTKISGTDAFRALLAPIALAAAATSFGCINAPVYFNSPAPLLEVTAGQDPPRSTNGFTLDFRRPTPDEQKVLDARRAAMNPADLDKRVPWVSRDKVHLELLFTVKNVDTTPGTFDLLVDGATEFTKFDENVVAMVLGAGGNANDPPQYLPLMNLHPSPLPKTLAPGETYQGTLREDDFNEGALDLDAMGRFAPDRFASLLINRSEVKPEDLAMVPADVVTPQLLEVDVTLSANKHMTCEWTLRVRDDDDRLWHVTGDHHFHPTPALFVPMLPMTP